MTSRGKSMARWFGGLGLSLAGLVTFAVCVGEPVGYFGLAAVVASLWVQ